MVLMLGGGNRQQVRFGRKDKDKGDDGGGGSPQPWSGWDLTNVPAPPILSNPVHYGGSGQSYPTAMGFGLDGGGGDILLENPADGQPLKNRKITIKNFRRVHIRGLHLLYDNKRFGKPRQDRNASLAAAESNPSEADGSQYGGGYSDYAAQVSQNPAFRLSSGWPDPSNNSYGYFKRSIAVRPQTFNAEVLYVEGLHIETTDEELHQADGFALQSVGGGGGYKFIMVNSRIDYVGTSNYDDRNCSGSRKFWNTTHSDCVQTQGGEVDEFHFYNSYLSSGYQVCFIPNNQNGRNYDFWAARCRLGSPPGEDRASFFTLAEGSQKPGFKLWDNMWFQRDINTMNQSAQSDGQLIRGFEGGLSYDDPPWTQTVSPAEAGDKQLHMRDSSATDIPDFAPADKVGANYVSPW